jgi:hypothetical protein
MSIDSATTYPGGNATNGGVRDTNVLNPIRYDEAFAAAIKAVSSKTVLDTIQNLSQTSDKDGNDRNQQRKEHNELADRGGIALDNRKSLDKTELRTAGIDNEYANRNERRTDLRNGHQDKLDRAERTSPTVETKITPTVSESVPTLLHLEGIAVDSQNTVVPGAGVVTLQGTISNVSPAMNPVAVSPNVPFANLTGAVLVQPVPPPNSMLKPMPNPQTSSQLVSVWTVFGRVGQVKNTAKDEDEKEEAVEKKKEKKRQPFATFGAVLAETVPPIQPKHRKQQQSSAELEAVTHRIEEHQNKEEERKGTTPADILKSNGQDISVSKEQPKEPPDRTQWMQRVAAACQSAANRSGTIRIKLNLDNLGSLSVKLMSKSNRLSVRFEAASEEAVAFLSESLNELKMILANRNVVLDQVEIERIGN